ncbi:MAG: hypothetical protein KDD73_06740 [Anaerolineales bacterium]|nr:hypothetical protein [Anaerolineales bacterium]MCB9128103.1 hypothetical protein [Ardenticatenales bacterium]MCB9171816.1 hypothetical protein [Ardenticatenales bacterium]
MSNRVRLLLSAGAGIPVGLLYGLVVRWLFGLDVPAGPEVSDAFIAFTNVLETMSIAFLFVVPVVIGALTVRIAPDEQRRSVPFALLMPWVSTILTLITVALLGMEAVICLVMALPIFLVLASLGGYLFRLPEDEIAPRSDRRQNMTLALLALLPFLVAPIEQRLPTPDRYPVVENTILIDAPVEAVWENIASVPLIQPEEQGFSAFHLLGLPKPLEATLSHEGVGGVRQATFENNLAFVETVTEWAPPYRISFSIVRDRDPRLPAPLTQIGGKYFDVLDGQYVVEPLADGRVRLHLRSTHRLSTTFNLYGSLWTERIMSDLQGYILRIIKARAEAGA